MTDLAVGHVCKTTRSLDNSIAAYLDDFSITAPSTQLHDPGIDGFVRSVGRPIPLGPMPARPLPRSGTPVKWRVGNGRFTYKEGANDRLRETRNFPSGMRSFSRKNHVVQFCFPKRGGGGGGRRGREGLSLLQRYHNGVVGRIKWMRFCYSRKTNLTALVDLAVQTPGLILSFSLSVGLLFPFVRSFERLLESEALVICLLFLFFALTALELKAAAIIKLPSTRRF